MNWDKITSAIAKLFSYFLIGMAIGAGMLTMVTIWNMVR